VSNPVLWSPSPERIAGTRLAAFQRFLVGRGYNVPLDYPALHAWSIDDLSGFWSAVWDFCGVIGEKGDKVLDGLQMPGARFFPDARLNLAENLLRADGPDPALVFFAEDRASEVVSATDLRHRVRRARAGLVALGVTKGDRVAGYLPNSPDAVVAMLATISIGAIWTSCSPDFGVPSVLDRFGQTQPKVLFATDGYFWKGKAHSTAEKVREITAALPELRSCVICPLISAAAPNGGPFVALADFGPGNPQELSFLRVPFDHPAFILYSSGTSGKPKCIVHSGGGVLLKHIEEHQLQADVRPYDRMLWYTTTGWMMWNWLVTIMASRAVPVLYDGSPQHPHASVLFDIAEKERVTHFGTSPKFLDLAEKSGLVPRQTHQLTALRHVLSTGSVLLPDSFEYVYRAIAPDICLSSVTGGTDIVGGFASGNPIGPVRRGEIQALALGMDVRIADPKGAELVGTPGELTCVKPFPTMPVGFWSDANNERYHAAYFDRYPHRWWHGDWATAMPEGGLVVHGRSDTTLNAGGVRIGSSEIYAQLDRCPEVEEAVAVGQEWQGDSRIVLFVRLIDGATLSQALVNRIRDTIRSGTTARHVPERILSVTDLPRTANGKLSESAVRDAVNRRAVPNLDRLANPSCLAEFIGRPELEI
jgi:acetoacetyl-CoA synthetase